MEERHPAGCAAAAEDLRHVRFDGLHGAAKPVCDVLVGEPREEEIEDAHLGFGQALAQGCCLDVAPARCFQSDPEPGVQRRQE
jgi:hypothetical protein